METDIEGKNRRSKDMIVDYVLYASLFLIFASQFALQYAEKIQSEDRVVRAVDDLSKDNDRIMKKIAEDNDRIVELINKKVEQFGCKCKIQ